MLQRPRESAVIIATRLRQARSSLHHPGASPAGGAEAPRADVADPGCLTLPAPTIPARRVLARRRVLLRRLERQQDAINVQEHHVDGVHQSVAQRLPGNKKAGPSLCNPFYSYKRGATFVLPSEPFWMIDVSFCHNMPWISAKSSFAAEKMIFPDTVVFKTLQYQEKVLLCKMLRG